MHFENICFFSKCDDIVDINAFEKEIFLNL